MNKILSFLTAVGRHKPINFLGGIFLIYGRTKVFELEFSCHLIQAVTSNTLLVLLRILTRNKPFINHCEVKKELKYPNYEQPRYVKNNKNHTSDYKNKRTVSKMSLSKRTSKIASTPRHGLRKYHRRLFFVGEELRAEMEAYD
jgi:hypothetical protein